MTSISRRRFSAFSGAALGTALIGAPAILHAAVGTAKGRLVIVGGGFGGASAARFARINWPQIAVTLIDPAKSFVTCPYGNLLLAGEKKLADISHSYDGLKQRGVTKIDERAIRIDAERKAVILASGRSIAYDKLIVSPGIGIRWGAIEGYDQDAAAVMPHAWIQGDGSQYTLLRQQLEAMRDGGVVGMAIPGNPFRCPPGPYERISTIASYLKKYKPRSKLLAFDAKDAFSKQPLFQDGWKELYPDIVEWVGAANDGKISKVDVQSKELISDFGTRHKVDVGNVIPPQQAAALLIDSGLTNETGWTPVNPATFEAAKAKDIFVIGDAANTSPMPKSAFMANNTSKRATTVAVAQILGNEPPAEPVYFNTCYSHVGEDYAISVVGVYRPKDGKFVEVEGSGGISPRGPLAEKREQRKAEVAYADGWYRSITLDAFS